jgi:hypothetical protein
MFAFLTTFKPFSVRHVPYLGGTVKAVKKFIGLGGLFYLDNTLKNNSTNYRFFKNNQWQAWQTLEQPLFEDYIESFNFDALHHCRIDRKLVGDLVNLKKKSDNLISTVQMDAFLTHLLYAHNNGLRPDSVEIRVAQHLPKEGKSIPLLKVKLKP